jgi:ankyrin repeat protein
MHDKILESVCDKKNWVAVLSRLKEIELSREDLEVSYGNSGQKLLHLLAKNGQLEALNLVLEQQEIEVDVIDNIKRTPLHLAVEHRHLGVVRALVESGANVNAIDRKGHTPIHVLNDGKNKRSVILEAVTDCVCGKDKPEDIIRFLAENGANVDFQDRNGSAVLHHAAQSGHAGIAKTLVKTGADVNARNKKGDTPIDVAVEELSAQTIPALLEGGASYQMPTQDDKKSQRLQRLMHGVAVQEVSGRLATGSNKEIRGAVDGTNAIMRAVTSTTAIPTPSTGIAVVIEEGIEPENGCCWMAFVRKICKMAMSRYD